MNSRIEIPQSKGKIILLLIGAIAFVVGGVFFALSPEVFATSRMRSPEVIRIVGILSISFFGICGYFIAKKFFDPKPGLIIDDEGITDNTNAASLGLIEWRDITGMTVVQVASTKFLVLMVNNPEKYISRAGGMLSKRAVSMNSKMYGSPVTIISNSLKMSFKELETLLKTELEKRGLKL